MDLTEEYKWITSSLWYIVRAMLRSTEDKDDYTKT